MEQLKSTDVSELIETGDWPIAAFIPRRYRPGNLGNWSGHLPFANDLIAVLQPQVLVELGTHYGESYFGFCQAVLENASGTTCYAVDHWLGEAHSGLYGGEVYDEVRAYNEANYQSFSYLLRSSFDDAVSQFSDQSIGLLHIDGLHTFDAGSHDFETWWPKISPGGIVLIHDIAVRHADFGIWRLWEQLCREYESFAFHHCWGLGVIRKPGPELPDKSFLGQLFRSSPDFAERLRRYYVLCASYLEHRLSVPPSTQQERTTDFIQLFPFRDEAYREETAVTRTIGVGESHVISADFPSGLGDGPLRVDPCEHDGFVQIQRLIVSSYDREILWDCDDPTLLEQLPASESVCVIEGIAPATFLSYGPDPHIYFHSVPQAAQNEPVTVTLELAIAHNLRDFARMLRRRSQGAPPYGGISQIKALQSQLENMRWELERVHSQLIEEKREAAQALGREISNPEARLGTVRCDNLERHGLIESRRQREILPQSQFAALERKCSELNIQSRLIAETLEAERTLTVELKRQLSANLDAWRKEREYLNQRFTDTTALFETERESWRVMQEQTVRRERQFEATQNQVSQLVSDRQEAELRAAKFQHKFESLQTQVSDVERINIEMAVDVDDLRRALELERSHRIAMERSLSWKITRPIRAFYRVFQNSRGDA